MPFARLQAYTGTQNAFTETGAQSPNLTVAQQTTNSLRSVLGASVDLGWREKLALQLKLGWSHEYADVSPVAATLPGAPAIPFMTFGISPTRDGVLLGLGANTAIAEATSIYLRYEAPSPAGEDTGQLRGLAHDVVEVRRAAFPPGATMSALPRPPAGSRPPAGPRGFR